jgi:hypothetical protein
MSNQYANLMRMGAKLPRESKGEDGRLLPFEPTQEERENVQTLAGNGVSEVIICKILKISKMTLRKRFKEEIAIGRDIVTAHMGAALVREGIAGNVAAIKYWLLTRGGPEWKLTAADIKGLDPFGTEDSRETVHFYMPSNGRDEPDDQGDIPTIDGEATESDAA